MRNSTHTPAISEREHARLARELIAAAGGLEEASRACRVSLGVLSTYQNAERPECNMPADVIADLERYAGRAIYSTFLADRQPTVATPETLDQAVCRFAEEAMDVQRFLRIAAVDGLTQAEIDQARRELAEAEEPFRTVREALNAAERALPRR